MDNNELNLTPLMKQYQEIKVQYPDSLLMFRLGDFYELFGDDAIKAHSVLGVVLTKRHSVPMCGVPFHSVTNYLRKLLTAGFKVAICEQLEDPKVVKGIVKRDVTRVITPGTILEERLLQSKKNNFLTSLRIYSTKDSVIVGIASVDISTGDFLITQFKDSTSTIPEKRWTKTINEISRLAPAEIILPESEKSFTEIIISQYKNVHIEHLEDWYFEPSTAEEKIKQLYKIKTLDTFGINSTTYNIALAAVGGIIEYLFRTQKNAIPKLKGIHIYSIEDYMFLDTSCIRNLELIENLYDRTEKNTLLDVLDETITSLGGRLLRTWILKPLLNIQEIKARQQKVELFFENDYTRTKIREKLKSINDIERIVNRISATTANPKDLLALKESLKVVPEIKLLITECINSTRISQIVQQEYIELTNIPELKNIVNFIDSAINPDAPFDIKKGNVIKQNFSTELDELKTLSSNAKSWILQYQEEQRQKTGISSLKVGYTSVFGYYIEVTNPNLHLVPSDYVRKQTLKNAERFITEELKRFEDKILSAEEKIANLEQLLFNNVLNEISNYSAELYDISHKIAKIDVYTTFAEIAKTYNYTKPQIDESFSINLKLSRHPVVEQILPPGKFIPNDVFIDGDDTQIMIITGPNMAGKSTFIRQVALCVIMAQIGSYVPCESAKIGIVDRIFARIGASDYLARGLSTFMVEMQETANILHNCTERSLVILDEIGRGTSTYDGISIAWSCVEYLINRNNWNSKKYGPKTLFATHYFELTELETKYNYIKNFNVAVKEYKDEIIFLYKIQRGCSDKSYGIHVAQLAGIPKEIIHRAKELLKYLQNSSSGVTAAMNTKPLQLEFGKLLTGQDNDSKIISELLENIKEIDINNLTPIEASNKILQWKKMINNATNYGSTEKEDENLNG